VPVSWKHIFARKDFEMLLAEAAGEHRLRRALGPVALTALGVGCIIGAGIFVMTGRAAALDAGPAVIVSYAIAGVGCALAALCYAEFAAMAPVAGSAYAYAYTTLGEIFAWIIGWDLILEYAMGCATVASAWTHYFNQLLAAIGLPQVQAALSHDPFTIVDGHRAVFNLPSVLIMVLVTTVLIVGIRESARTNATLVLVKLLVVVFVIILGWAYVDPLNWTGIPVSQRIVSQEQSWGLLGEIGINRWLAPIDDATRTPFSPYGLSGIMLGGSIVFFAFIGFDSISTHAEEARRPQRDVPIGILVSLCLCTLLYIAVAAVVTGMVPYAKIDIEAPIAQAFAQKAAAENSSMLRGATAVIAIGGLAGMTSVLLVLFLSQARVFMAMSRDGLLPQIFGTVHPRFRTPHIATAVTGVVICVAAALTPIYKLEEMVNVGTLLAFVMVCAAVLILRFQRPAAQRPFRCPVIYLVAPLGVVVNLALMLFLPLDTWLRLVVWLAIGLLIYFFYSRRHSLLTQHLLHEIQMPRDEETGTVFDPEEAGE
jgi:basic amino acid/polyamine antiporter, APA family